LVLVQLRKQRRLLVHEIFSGSGGNFGVGFQAPVSADVQDLMASFDEHPAHEQTPVAVRGIFFAAHQCHAEVRHPALEALDSGVKCRILRHAAIEHMAALVVVCGIAGTAAQFGAEKEVLDPGLRQVALNDLAIELRCELGIWSGSGINYDVDAIFSEQPQKLLN
jgi:hypothetical protein